MFLLFTKLFLFMFGFFFSFCLAGNVWTASAHIITAVIGSGVLSLAWATAQLGWIAGPSVLLLFSFVTFYTSSLLASCYRSGDPVNGKRNYTYMEVVRSNLGKPFNCITKMGVFFFFFLNLFNLIPYIFFSATFFIFRWV